MYIGYMYAMYTTHYNALYNNQNGSEHFYIIVKAWWVIDQNGIELLGVMNHENSLILWINKNQTNNFHWNPFESIDTIN